MKEKFIVAIDGQSGCGKSSTAKAIAAELGYIYIDTGAMYRATTLYLLKNDTDIHNEQALENALKQISLTFRNSKGGSEQEIYLNGISVENDIRQQFVSDKVSEVSAIPRVRRQMVGLQRELGNAGGVVMDGRDIGTVVFPNADVKIFMKADLDIRAKRRLKELEEKNIPAVLEEVEKNLAARDKIDSTRLDSPLKKADDAIEIDTSQLSFDEQVNKILDLIKSKQVA